MRFLLVTSPRQKSESCGPPDSRLMAAIDRLCDEMTREGVLLQTGGMGPSTRMHLGGGEIRVVGGPYAESKEVIGGYAIVQARSLEEAVAMTRRFLSLHREILGPDYETDNEIRRLYGPWDHEGMPAPVTGPSPG